MAGQEKEKNPRQFPLSALVILLFAALVASSGMVGFALGRNAARSTGELMDTIVLSPGDSASRTQAVLHYLAGVLTSPNGEPKAGMTVRLDADRSGLTNEYGKFYLSDIRSGEYVLTVLDQEENQVASFPFSLDFSGNEIGADSKSDLPVFSMPEDTRLLELTFVLEDDTLFVEDSTACFVTRDGQVVDFERNSLPVRGNALAVTPGGNVAASDGAVLLPTQEILLTPAGAQQEVPVGTEPLPGVTVEEDGSAVTETGAVILPGNEIEIPDGTVIGGDHVVIIEDDRVEEVYPLPETYVPPEEEPLPEDSSAPEDSGSPEEGVESSPEPEGEEEDGLPEGLSVSDGRTRISWQQQSTVDLFKNRTDNMNLGEENGIPVAAPGSKGYYDFLLENPEDYDISYTIAIEEKTFHLPILYSVVDRADNTNYLHRERTNGKDALVSPKILIPAGTTQRFRIEWAWQYEDWFDYERDDAIDTAATKGDRCYEVAVAIRAEQANGSGDVDLGDDTRYPGKH